MGILPFNDDPQGTVGLLSLLTRMRDEPEMAGVDPQTRGGAFPAAPAAGGMPAPMAQPQTPPVAASPAASGGGALGSIFGGQSQSSSFNFGDFLSALAPAIAALDPRNQSLSAALLNVHQQRRKDRKHQKAKDETVHWLRGQGLSDQEAAYLASDPAALRAWYGDWKSGGKQSWINAGGGHLYNPNDDRWITAPGQGETYRRATPEEAAAYGSSAGQFGPGGRFYPINPPSGMEFESDGQGGFRLVQGVGAGSRPLTEGQSKDATYATRAEGSLGTLNDFGDALTNPFERALDFDPTGLIRRHQTPDFQQARQAGDEFLQAILRKDTGAAITKAEMDEYGRTYLPQPGDGPEVLAQKRVARIRALEALKAGMPPQAILAQERALERSSGGSDIDPGLFDYMTPEERALFQ